MPSTSDRRPWLAALLNVLFPGLGFLYAGETKQVGLGAVMPLVGITAGALAALFLPSSLFSAILFDGAQPAALLLLGVLGWRSAQRAPIPFVPGKLNRWYWYWAYAAAITWGYVAGVAPVIRHNLVQAYRIPSESMVPTLMVGDYLVIDRRSAFQERVADGDLVVFRSMEDTALVVLKRVAGTPGDTLEMRHGVLYRDGYAQRHDPFIDTTLATPDTPEMVAHMRAWQTAAFAGPVPPDYKPDPSNWGPISVPSGYFFALGDHRNASWDSRYYGLVRIDYVLGRPRLIYWQSAGMWGRIGKGLE